MDEEFCTEILCVLCTGKPSNRRIYGTLYRSFAGREALYKKVIAKFCALAQTINIFQIADFCNSFNSNLKQLQSLLGERPQELYLIEPTPLVDDNGCVYGWDYPAPTGLCAKLQYTYHNYFLVTVQKRKARYQQRIAFINGFYDKNSLVSRLPYELVYMICALIE